MVFVVLTPGVAMNIDDHLAGYDEMLDFFGFGDWHLISSRELVGPNWKIAYDGYLDFYHLPFLHRASFGPDISHRPIYNSWGPHQRVTSPDPALLELKDQPEEEWNLDVISGGVWTIFPHVSIAGGNAGGLVSQLFPGNEVGHVGDHPELLHGGRAERRRARRSDGQGRLPGGRRSRRGLRDRAAPAAGAGHGGQAHRYFGRNEGGGQNFHRQLDELITAGGDAPPAVPVAMP